MPSTIGLIDLLVLATSLVTVIFIGLRARGQIRDMDSYLLGDRELPWWAILGSIVATETSTATVLSVPGLGYGDVGMKFLQIAMGYIVGRIVVVRVLLPLYFQGRLYTAYQVLGERFGPVVRKAASALFLVTRNLGDGLRLFLAALVLQQLVHWPLYLSLLVMGAITIFYTYFGGMRSVVWNDCLQFVIYMVGAFASIFVIVSQIPGGWTELMRFAEEHQKFRVFEFNLTWSDPYNFWAGLFGGALLTLGTHGTDHMMVQRYLSARNQREAGKAIVLSGLTVFLQFAVFLFIGIELACYYSGQSHLNFTRTDQVFSEFLVKEFPRNTGLIGLMLAAILAAAMSTLSSSLNSSAAALVNDFILPRKARSLTPSQTLALTRRASILFGVLQVGVGFGATLLNRAVVENALTIAGFSAGLLLGVYALGVLTVSVGEMAALGGAIIGLIVLLYLQFGQFVLENLSPHWAALDSIPTLPPIAWPWLALIGSTVTFAAGVTLSRLLPARSHSPT